MTILLLGGTGQIGYALARVLPRHLPLRCLERNQLDLAQPDQVRAGIRALRPAVLINAAAYTDVEGAERDEALALRINGEASGVMAEEMRRLGGTLIHYSSDYVFDGEKSGLYREADNPTPCNAYGRSKLAGELAIQRAGGAHIILRTSWVYSARRQNFLTALLRLWRQGQTLRVVDDQFGTPTSARTVAVATAAVLKRLLQAGPEAAEEFSGIYHLAATGLVSRYDFARVALAAWDLQAAQSIERIPTSAFPSRVRRPASSGLDNAKFVGRFGPLPGWRQDLAACLRDAAWREQMQKDGIA